MVYYLERRSSVTSIFGLTLLVFALIGCSSTKYEYLEFKDKTFALKGEKLGSVALRGSFADKEGGKVKKGPPYTLLITIPVDSDESEKAWSLSELEVEEVTGEKVPIDKFRALDGKAMRLNSGELKILFKQNGLILPHQQLQIRFRLHSPDDTTTPVHILVEPYEAFEETSSWLDSLLSV